MSELFDEKPEDEKPSLEVPEEEEPVVSETEVEDEKLVEEFLESSTPDNVSRSFGYDIERENLDLLNYHGSDADVVLQAAQAQYPEFNPYAEPWLERQSQGHMGSCQGHALSHCFQVALVQQYGIQAVFSRMSCYILSQEADGIRGDHGSTLHGGQKAAKGGVCLEHEWPYPSRYSRRHPDSAYNKCNISMPGSRQIKDADLMWELLKAGCAIQTGVSWNNSFEKKVSNTYRRSRSVGGHSTMLYGLDEETDNAIHWNSWSNWQGNGRSQWTKDFVHSILKYDRTSVFVCYDSTNLVIPDDLLERVKEQ